MLTERVQPRPAPGEVLIRVGAAGVNGHDLHQRHDGGHLLLAGESDLPGLEVAGVVEALGADVSEWSVGDRVCALLRGGGYAEYAVARAEHCLPVPAGLSLVEAASLPETYFTVWSNLYVDTGLRAGERLLMNGGTSGIGVAAIQLASRFGVEVYATASGPEKTRVCRELGAKLAVDYLTEDFVEVIRAATGGEGVDVVLEIVAGDYIAKDLEILRMDGRLVVIGAARGPVAEIDFTRVARKRLVLRGSTLRPRSNAYKADVARTLRARVWPLIEAGEIRPVVHAVFDLAEAGRSHALMEARGHVGKVMLRVGSFE